MKRLLKIRGMSPARFTRYECFVKARRRRLCRLPETHHAPAGRCEPVRLSPQEGLNPYKPKQCLSGGSWRRGRRSQCRRREHRNSRISACGVGGILFGANKDMVNTAVNQGIVKGQIAAPGYLNAIRTPSCSRHFTMAKARSSLKPLNHYAKKAILAYSDFYYSFIQRLSQHILMFAACLVQYFVI